MGERNLEIGIIPLSGEIVYFEPGARAAFDDLMDRVVATESCFLGRWPCYELTSEIASRKLLSYLIVGVRCERVVRGPWGNYRLIERSQIQNVRKGLEAVSENETFSLEEMKRAWLNDYFPHCSFGGGGP